ncbi:MAG: hypothetical protein KIT83_21170 [Bryobacterales bacterium]|nr:hypothetical protein [Bryobacterales bacterium]
MELSLPHAVFVYGERFPITITLRNPTSSSLELPILFRYGTGTIVAEQKDSRHAKEHGVEYWPTSPAEFPIDPTSPTFFLPAGTNMVRSLWSSSTMELFSVSMPRSEGKYRVRYTYGPSNTVYFDVREAATVNFVEIVSLAAQDPGGGGAMTVAVFSARVDDEWWLFQTWPMSSARLPADRLKSGTPLNTGDLSSFVRIARLPSQIGRLGASLIGDQTLHIEYQTQDGSNRTIETEVTSGIVLKQW